MIFIAHIFIACFKYYMYLCNHKYRHAVVAQLVEHQLPKLRVAGSSPVYRSDTKGVETQPIKLVSTPLILRYSEINLHLN